jgi:hypothetical protein
MRSTAFFQASSEAWQWEVYGYHSPCFACYLACYLSRDGLRCLWAPARRALGAVRYAAADRAGPLAAVAELSVQAPQQRRWGSLYDALGGGAISSGTLEQVLARYPLAGGEPI